MLRLHASSIAVSIVLAGVIHADDLYTMEESFSVVPENGSNIIIENINGDIVIEEWSSENVLVEYSIKAESLREIESVIVECLYIDGIICSAILPDDNDSIIVDFHVSLPESLNLNLVLFTANGCIAMNSGSGTSLVEILDGSAVLDGFDGNLTVNIVSGVIDIRNTTGLSVANIISGTIKGTISNIEDNIAISTVSGDIDLVIENESFITVTTMSGEIDIPGVEVQQELYCKSVEFGDGEFKIDISTVSGDIRIRF